MQDPDSVLEEIGRGLIQIPSPFPLPEGEGRKAGALPEKNQRDIGLSVITVLLSDGREPRLAKDQPGKLTRLRLRPTRCIISH